MIRSYQSYRPTSIRLALIVALFFVAPLAIGDVLAHVATQIVPASAAPAVCVSAPAVAPVSSAPMVPILSIKPQPVNAESLAVDLPKPIKVRYAKAVHGRVRGRFTARD